MAQEKDKSANALKLGWIFFSLFATLIISGIVVKRVFGHPEFMMFFHVPAAVFLILAGRKLTTKLKLRYEQENSFDTP